VKILKFELLNITDETGSEVIRLTAENYGALKLLKILIEVAKTVDLEDILLSKASIVLASEAEYKATTVEDKFFWNTRFQEITKTPASDTRTEELVSLTQDFTNISKM
jgi:hypothetical protein